MIDEPHNFLLFFGGLFVLQVLLSAVLAWLVRR